MKKQINQSTICNIMAVTSSLMALIIFIAGMITSQIFARVTDMNVSQATLSNNLRMVVSESNYQKDMMRSYTQNGDTLFLEMYNKNGTGETDQIIATMTNLTRDDQGQLQLKNITEYISALQATEKQIIGLVQAGKLEEAQAMAFGKDYGLLVDGLSQAVGEFEVGMSKGIGTIITNQSDKIMILGIAIQVLCVILIIVQIINAAVTKKFIVRPLVKLKDSMIEMSQGHLSGAIEVPVDNTEMGLLAGAMVDMRSKISDYIKEIDFILHCISQKDVSVQVENNYIGDFEPIQRSLNLILASLTETFSTISRSIDQVSGGASQVSYAAQTLAQGTTEQASSVEHLSASINQIADQINSNLSIANETNQLAVTAGDSLSISNQQMSTMMAAMSEISTSSAEISKIIKTIEDIAFQTNILALNAAVEAARAGSAGKGFAVVADEVRNLATKSSEAAKQTNVLIEKSVKSVENGVKIANETATSLSSVVSGSLAMADLIEKISHACNDQATSISAINMGVEEISSVVQTNSATSEESAAASEEVSVQAGIMKSMVDQYKF